MQASKRSFSEAKENSPYILTVWHRKYTFNWKIWKTDPSCKIL